MTVLLLAFILISISTACDNYAVVWGYEYVPFIPGAQIVRF